MDAFVITTLTSIVLLCGVHKVKAESCGHFNHTNCSSCVELKDENCYWCGESGECAKWDWSNYPATGCKQRYYYKQCDVNGLEFIVTFSVVLFLLVAAIIVCCICCCCCCCCKRRGRKGRYELVPRGEQDDRNDTVQRAHVHVRRIEIRRNYGATTENNSTAEDFSSSVP